MPPLRVRRQAAHQLIRQPSVIGCSSSLPRPMAAPPAGPRRTPAPPLHLPLLGRTAPPPVLNSFNSGAQTPLVLARRAPPRRRLDRAPLPLPSAPFSSRVGELVRARPPIAIRPCRIARLPHRPRLPPAPAPLPVSPSRLEPWVTIRWLAVNQVQLLPHPQAPRLRRRRCPGSIPSAPSPTRQWMPSPWLDPV